MRFDRDERKKLGGMHVHGGKLMEERGSVLNMNRSSVLSNPLSSTQSLLSV